MQEIFLFFTGRGASQLIFGTNVSSSGAKLDWTFLGGTNGISQMYLTVVGICAAFSSLFLVFAGVKISLAKKDTANKLVNTGVKTTMVGAGAFLAPTLLGLLLVVVNQITNIFIGGSALPPNYEDQIASNNILSTRVNKLIDVGSTSSLTLEPENIYMPEIIFKGSSNSNDPNIEVSLGEGNVGSAPGIDGHSPVVTTPSSGGNINNILILIDSINEQMVSTTLDNTIHSKTNFELFANSVKDILSNVVQEGTGYINSTLLEEAAEIDSTINEIFGGSSESIFNFDDDGKMIWNEKISLWLESVKTNILDIPLTHDEDKSSVLFDTHFDLTVESYKLNYFINDLTDFGNRWSSDITESRLISELQTLVKNNDGITASLASRLRLFFIFKNYNHYLEKLFSDFESDGHTAPENMFSITDVQSMLNIILNGDSLNKLSSGNTLSIIGIAEQLSVHETGGLTIAMYRLASGNKDTNWRSTPDRPNLTNILIGFVAISIALFIMYELIGFSIERIGMLAILLIMAPFTLLFGIFDEGKSFKSWQEIIISKAIGVISIVIAFRVYDVILRMFDVMIESGTDSFLDGLTGIIVKALVSIMLLNVVLKASKTVASIIGLSAGVESLGDKSSGLTAGLTRSAGSAGIKLGAKGARGAKGAAKGANATRKRAGLGSKQSVATARLGAMKKKQASKKMKANNMKKYSRMKKMQSHNRKKP